MGAPAIRQPRNGFTLPEPDFAVSIGPAAIVELADRRRRQVGQQLRQVMLRIDAVPAAGAGQAGQDRGGLAAALVADEQTVFAIEAIRFISRSAMLLSIGIAPSVVNTFSSFH